MFFLFRGERRRSKRRREIIVPKSPAPQDARPIRAETRVKLIASIARGRRWLDEIASGKVTDVEQIAAREKCSIRKVNMTISLAFLAPESGQSRRRRSSAARDWSCSSLRCSGRVVASVPDTRPSKSVSRRYPAYRRKLLPLLVVAIASTKARSYPNSSPISCMQTGLCRMRTESLAVALTARPGNGFRAPETGVPKSALSPPRRAAETARPLFEPRKHPHIAGYSSTGRG